MSITKKKVVWNKAEIAEILKGAVVEEVGGDYLVLRKDGGRFYVYAVCYQCGSGRIVIESEAPPAPPQRG